MVQINISQAGISRDALAQKAVLFYRETVLWRKRKGDVIVGKYLHGNVRCWRLAINLTVQPETATGSCDICKYIKVRRYSFATTLPPRWLESD